MTDPAQDIEVFASRGDWASACAGRLETTLRQAVNETGRASLAGAGGSTPTPIYRQLTRAGLDWSAVTVTLVDERYVPANSPLSNAALIQAELLQGAAAGAQFIPLFAPAVTVDRAAALASHRLGAAIPRLDAVLLGMGEDGHICSMFPHSPTLGLLLHPDAAPEILGVPPGRDGMAPPQERLSMNLGWLRTARRIVLALTGDTKRRVFEAHRHGDVSRQPIAALMAIGVPVDVLWTEAT